MKNLCSYLTMLVLGVCLISPSHAGKQETPEEYLLGYYYDLLIQPGDSAGSVRLTSPVLVKQFYKARDWQPAWTENYALTPMARQFVSILNNAGQDGLDNSLYHLTFLNDVLNTEHINSRPLRFELDLLLTDAFLTYSGHLLHGQIHPETVFDDWPSVPRELDLVAVLNEALVQNDIQSSIDNLYPVPNAYLGLRDALIHYRALLSRDTPVIPPGPAMKPGIEGPRVLLVKQKLLLLDDLEDSAGDTFDASMEMAVRRFQQRHGLETDGIIGARTLAALNVSIAQRIRQIEINLERIRWLPRDPGDRFIIVNIADFSLRLIENQNPVLNSRVIVGKKYHETPVFSKDMTYIAFSPYWNIPRSIATKEILPKLRENPAYLEQQQIRVFENQSGLEVNPAILDWNTLSGKDFPYHFRQDPGPKNSLGKVKFMFPNAYNVYLHDTPAQALFGRSIRDFSHGCIRVEKAAALANYLLQDQPLWDRQQVAQAMQAEKEQAVRLTAPVPVHIIYITAWVENDMVQFRDDIYGRDERLLNAQDRVKK